ncbi:hypothetical protein HK101_004911 [Irineochytrium annulatum]|nr:hypothetical protein HK101_004911 [Irineochytrium annulatum]
MMARPALARRNDNVLAARDMHHGKLLGAGVTLGIGGGIGIGAGGIIVSNGPAPPAPTPQPVVAPSPNAPVIAVPSVVDQPRHPPPPVTSTIFFTPNPTPATPTPATPAPATPTPSAASPTFPTLGAPSSAGNPGRGSPSHTPAQDTTTQIGPTPNNVPSLATGPTNSNTASSTKLVLGLTIPLALLFLVGLPAFLYFRLRRARARKQFAATLKRSSMNASPGSFRTESDDKPQVPPADADAGTSGAAAAGSATALEEGKAPAPVNKDAKSVVKSVVKK